MAICFVLSGKKDEEYGGFFLGKGVFSVNSNSRVMDLLEKSNFWYRSMRISRENGVVFFVEDPCIIWMMDWALIVNKTSLVGEITTLWIGI